MLRRLTNLTRSIGRRAFAYDATETGTKRRAIKIDTRPEDSILDPRKRARLISAARDLHRNLATAAWALRTHCAHVAQHTFQAKTGDDALDEAIEGLMSSWSAPEACDAAGRHPLHRLIYLAEMGRVREGEVLLLMLRDGRLQAIESDRVAQPEGPALRQAKGTVIQGVEIDAAGRPVRYAIHSRDPSGALKFTAWIDAQSVIHHGYFDRLDQVRGVSPLAAAIAPLTDQAEAEQYALLKAKVSQYFGLKIKRADGGSIDGNTADQAVNFGKGPILLDLPEGDDAEFMTVDNPGPSFQEYMRAVTMTALKALDIDFSFFDSSHTNYSGARQALLLYKRSALIRQREVRDVLDRITRWKVRSWVADGRLILPRSRELDSLRWDWVPGGLGWVNPLQEVKAQAAAVDAGLTSRQRLAREQGEDWFEIADQLAQEQSYAREKGIALSGAAGDALPWGDAANPTHDQEAAA